MRMADWLYATTISRVGGLAFHLVETPATAAVIRLDREDDFKRKVRLAFIALADDPGCIEARLFLAENTVDDHRAFAHLSKAVKTGRHLWGPVAAAEKDFVYWGVAATRPFMRALEAMGDWHEVQGQMDAANEIYDELLEKIPWTAKESGLKLRQRSDADQDVRHQ